MAIRSERPEDAAAVRSINEAAFGRPDETVLIDRLRAEGAVLLSLLAEHAACAAEAEELDLSFAGFPVFTDAARGGNRTRCRPGCFPGSIDAGPVEHLYLPGPGCVIEAVH
jgi:hypothetical protein